MQSKDVSTVDFLRNKNIFKDLDEYEFMKVLQFSKKRYFPKNSVIIEESSEGGNLYFIKGGSVRVCRVGADGRREAIIDLCPDEYFGEISFVDNEPRSATVVAAEDAEIIEFDRNAFMRFLNDNKDIGFKVYWALAHIFCYRLRDTTDYLTLFINRSKYDIN
jgi:CRP-like cAMP-binding protein